MPLWHRYILCEHALAVLVGADDLPVGAQVVVALPALIALTASKAHIGGDPVAHLEIPHVLAHFHDRSAPLMARNDGVLRVAVFDMDHFAGQQLDIRGAETSIGNLRQHLIVFYLRRGNIRILDDFRLHKADSFHML